MITVDESKADFEVPETEKISTIVFVVNDSSDTDRATVEFSDDVTGNVKGKVVRISIERVSEEEGRYTAEFTADGETISGYIQITLHIDPSKGTPSVRWIEGDILMDTVAIDNEKGTITFATTHNSTYQIEYAEPISINWSIVLVLVLIVALAAYLLVSKR